MTKNKMKQNNKKRQKTTWKEYKQLVKLIKTVLGSRLFRGMIRVLLKFFPVLLSVFVLGGCQLAKEDGAGQAAQPQLVGVLVTREYLDLFDMEGWLSENADSLTGAAGGLSQNRVVEVDSKFEGKLYARLVTETVTDAQTGEKEETKRYVFGDVAGILFAYTADGDVVSMQGDASVTDVDNNVAFSDEGESVHLEGTICVPVKKGGSVHFYINPVYQNSDGSLYAVTGNGMQTPADMEGQESTMTVSETVTVSENGTEQKRSVEVKMNIKTVLLPEEIRIVQMDDAHRKLDEKVFTRDRLPEKMETGAETAYIIVETQTHNGEGAVIKTRSLVSRDDEVIEIYDSEDGETCMKKQVMLIWTDEHKGRNV